MTHPSQSSLRILLLAATVLAGSVARADTPGQADLDLATQLQLNIRTPDDIDKVINLCESTEKQGLDKANIAFAHEILGAALLHRGVWRGNRVLNAAAVAPAEAVRLRALALADLERGVKLSPQQPEALLLIARLNARPGGDMKRALDALDEALRADDIVPDVRVQALLWRARVHAAQSHFDAALRDLNDAAAKAPGNIDVLLWRANVHAALGKNEKALEDFDQVLRRRHGFPQAIHDRALLLHKMGKTGAAIEGLEQARSANPNDPETLGLLGSFYSAAHKYDKAIAAFTVLSDIEPENTAALRCRGDLFLAVGKHAEAVADYERAELLGPKDAMLLNNLAWVLATSPVDKLRDGGRAIKLATDACKLTDYKDVHSVSTLAAAYAETGDFKTAVQWAKKAVELGKGKQKAALEKELASYQAGKPIREMKTGNEPDEDDEPAAAGKGLGVRN